jgi:hypothetical protein
MASNYAFPTTIQDPVVTRASDSGSTYTHSKADSTIESKVDAAYRMTRPRATRVINTYTYSWTGLTDTEYKTLCDFWDKVRKSEAFSFTDYQTGKALTVRFTNDFEFVYDHPFGWRGTLKFEEV